MKMDNIDNDDDDYSPNNGEEEDSESGDDEETLEEEENLLQDADVSDEISALQQEQDLPLEDLMRLYGYNKSPAVASPRDQEAMIFESEQGSSSKPSLSVDINNYFLLNDDGDVDEDYVPNESWKKEIRIGADYQAEIGDLYDEPHKINSSDKMLEDCQLIWDPDALDDQFVTEYLTNYYRLDNSGSPKSSDIAQIPDDEMALKILYENRYDQLQALDVCSKTLRRQRKPNTMMLSLASAPLSWTEEEMVAFEDGLKLYGKNFYLIQKNVFNQKTVADLVRYYYFWKKTERHDEFFRSFQFEKRPFHFHSSSVDYADHFLNSLAGGNIDHVALPEFGLNSSTSPKSLNPMSNGTSGNLPNPLSNNNTFDLSPVASGSTRLSDTDDLPNL